MIIFSPESNFDFSKIKFIRVDDKCTVYELDNMVLKLYDEDDRIDNLLTIKDQISDTETTL